MSTNPELGLAAMYRFIKKSGAERVSDEAANELRKILEEVAAKVASQALDLSIHAGRKTIKSEDIRLAAKNIIAEPGLFCKAFYLPPYRILQAR
jgi:histone H3/H4